MHAKNWRDETDRTHQGYTNVNGLGSLVQQNAPNSKLRALSAQLEQSIAQEESLYPGETASRLVPYVVRDNAWNFAGHDATNFYDYRDDAPDGYKEHIKYQEPHPTNQPYRKYEADPEHCEAKAAKLLQAATTSAEMKMAKWEVDKCVHALNVKLRLIDPSTPAPEKPEITPPAPAASPAAPVTPPVLPQQTPVANATATAQQTPIVNATTTAQQTPVVNATAAAVR